VVNTGKSRGEVVVVRPRPSLAAAGWLSFLLVSVPLYGALYWLASQNDRILPVAISQAVVIVFVAVCFVRYRRVSFEIDDENVIERHFMRRDEITPLSMIATIVFAETYRSSSADTLPQLLALDGNNKRLLRMRGQFWTSEEMRRFAGAVKKRTMTLDGPLSQEEFFEAYPGTAFWYEGNRTIVVLAAFVGLAVTAALVTGLMDIVGSPIARN
jgi:hypothetical protein